MADVFTSLIDSSSRLHAARAALRDLLYTVGFAAKKWFWYGEVGTYGNSAEWWPLLSARYRAKNGNTVNEKLDYLGSSELGREFEKPQFYKDYLDATTGGEVLSVVDAVQRQFASSSEKISPLPVFAVFNSTEDSASKGLQETLIKRAEAISRFGDGRYETIPSISQMEAMKREPGEKAFADCVESYAKYVANVMNPTRPLADGIDGSLYPNHAWVYAIPIYDMRNERPLMLATFIIIVEAPVHGLDQNGAVARFREVEQYLRDLEVHATHLLTHRFHNTIDGYVPGSDPIALLAHPSLCNIDNLDQMRLEGLEHDIDGFEIAFKKKDSVLRRTYERSFLTPKSIPSCGDSQIRVDARKALRVREQALQDSEALAKNNPETKAFSWLKPLYAHQRSRAHLPQVPSTNGQYTHTWLDVLTLCELIGMIELPGAGHSHKQFAKAYLYPINADKDASELFQWPVEPGVRFLIPWIHMVHGLAGLLSSDHMEILVISGSNENWANDSSNTCNGPDSPSIQAWLNLRNVKEPRPNGLLAAIHCPPNRQDEQDTIEKRARGWTRALFDPFRRRGTDITFFQHLILGDLGAAMHAHGLVFPAADPLFLPLKGSMPIDIDISASQEELLIGVTWSVPRC